METGFPDASKSASRCLSALLGAGKTFKNLLPNLNHLKNIAIRERLLKANNLSSNQALWPLVE